MMGKREKFANIAKETLEIVKNGLYVNDMKEEVVIEDTIKRSVANTILYTPKDTDALLTQIKQDGTNETIIEVTNDSTLNVAKRLRREGFDKVLALNFASARNPGGGFLNGSSAQEESLARSSALYETLISKREMYEYNRKLKTCLYSDYMIYSPNVPVFRNDEGNLLDEPYIVSFVTSPAVNAGIVRSKESMVAQNQINQVMKKRIEKILSLGIHHGYETIVLGAFGCGVFKNNPKDVAEYFKEAIHNNPKLQNQYKKIVFAVLDFSEQKQIHNTFNNVLMK
ncbi:TIGR02452 family protein [Bacillus cereus]|nr:TIGR02452 family protein [Bacillus cereus]